MSGTKDNLRNKIIELMEYRQLPELIDLVESSTINKTQLIKELCDIQEAIYHLDHVLESEWEIIESSLKGKWEAIYNTLLKA